MITHEEFTAVLVEVIAVQGYFVIGCPSDSPRVFQIGEKTHRLMQYEMASAYVIVDGAHQSDWNKQNDLMQRLRPDWKRISNSRGGRFFKVQAGRSRSVMITSCTFIPSQRAKDLLCKLWIEFGTWGETRPILIELRAELGREEFARFEKDLARGMERKSARTAVHQIIRAAILRGEEQDRIYRTTLLRTIYQPA